MPCVYFNIFMELFFVNVVTVFVLVAPSDKELMNLMMSRLSGLEQRVQYQAKELSEKVHFLDIVVVFYNASV